MEEVWKVKLRREANRLRVASRAPRYLSLHKCRHARLSAFCPLPGAYSYFQCTACKLTKVWRPSFQAQGKIYLIAFYDIILTLSVRLRSLRMGSSSLQPIRILTIS